jgi:hypothetical protein
MCSGILYVTFADPVDPKGVGRVKTNSSVPVTREEIDRQLYQPLPEEWHGLHSARECRRISRGLEQVTCCQLAEISAQDNFSLYNYFHVQK